MLEKPGLSLALSCIGNSLGKPIFGSLMRSLDILVGLGPFGPVHGVSNGNRGSFGDIMTFSHNTSSRCGRNSSNISPRDIVVVDTCCRWQFLAGTWSPTTQILDCGGGIFKRGAQPGAHGRDGPFYAWLVA